MDEKNNKSPEEASNLFHNIMKASVKGNPKPASEYPTLDDVINLSDETAKSKAQIIEVSTKIQIAIYDGDKEIQVKKNSLETGTLEYLKKYEYKIRHTSENTIIYW